MCVNQEDVVRSIKFARDHNLVLAVRSGGHSFAGHGACDDGLVINLSMMKRVQVDALARTVRIESGTRAGELDQVTQAFGLAIPLGSCPTVGVAGYTLGGGEGSLTPKLGYGCDSMLGASIITADGQKLRASENENGDLFWALRGGGGNFGIVTSIDFRLHQVGKILSGHLKYPIRRMRDVLRFVDDYVQEIPDELYIIATVLPRPGERKLDVAVVWSGEPGEGERVLHPLRSFIKVAEDTIDLRPYLVEQQSGSDSPSEATGAATGRPAICNVLPPTRLTLSPTTQQLALRKLAALRWFIGMKRGARSPATTPLDFAGSDTNTGYIPIGRILPIEISRTCGSMATAPDWSLFSTGAVYVHDLMAEGEQRIKAAYGDKYARLARIKRIYDPDNVFRVNQNIKPTAEP